jgi:solute carrier family 25 phosphate transporter 3
MTEEQKKSLSGPSKFGISLGSGVIAGFAAAVLSHVSSAFPGQDMAANAIFVVP